MQSFSKSCKGGGGPCLYNPSLNQTTVLIIAISIEVYIDEPDVSHYAPRRPTNLKTRGTKSMVRDKIASELIEMKGMHAGPETKWE